jgi:putative transferase (TIGR04331 family)
MEFFRTPAYRTYLDQTLAGLTGHVDCRTHLHQLEHRLPAYAQTVAYMSCLPRNFRYQLQLTSLGRIRFLENKPSSLEFTTDWGARQQLRQHVEDSLFRDFPNLAGWIAARVQELFPKSLLEHLAVNLLQKQSLPRRRTLFSADGWQIIDDWKIYALSQKIAHDTHWIGSPNAISHGSLAVFWQREFEVKHLDSYLTWGWSGEGGTHVHAFYSPHFAGQHQAAPVRTSSNNGLLISAAARPQHLLEYPYTPDRFERYLTTQMHLASRVFELTKQPVAIRTRPRDLGWDVPTMVKALGKTLVTLEFQQGKFSERLAKCRLHICDNCSTTIVESFWNNHPTLILISDDFFQIRHEATNAYNDLEIVGILHTSIESLLRQLDKLESTLDSWWQASNTQAAIRRFLALQGRTGSGLRQWKTALLPAKNSIQIR